MSLEVRGLDIGRGGRLLLRGVSFDCRAGQAVSIHGRNGLGKTSLLRTLAGLQPPMAGALGHDVDQVAYAGHVDGIKATLTVAETLGFWARIYGTDRVGEAVAGFGLEGLMARRGGRLSAGQRRRCALARLVLSGRPVWLLDEPTAALDAAGRAELRAVLEAHLDGGGMALMVTHGEPPLPCEALDLEPFAAGDALAGGAFAEAVE
ncbi:MAG: heme ABC exporter ATP-binding protein CcmA [Pseudomonadota bacterium]